MKKFILIIIIFLGCKNAETYPNPENALDAAREFINGYLTGDFNKAEFYMLKDPENEKLLKQLQSQFNLMPANKREQYKSASIIINNEETLNDSTHIIYYKNSFDNVAHKTKAILKNKLWLVDFKYTMNGNL